MPNLIPITTSEQARELGQLGGQSRSVKKSQAATLRELKKKSLTDVSAKRIVEMIEDRDYSALDILQYLDSLREQCTTVEQKIKLGNLLVAWHKSHHGDKKITTTVDNGFESIRDAMFVNVQGRGK